MRLVQRGFSSNSSDSNENQNLKQDGSNKGNAGKKSNSYLKTLMFTGVSASLLGYFYYSSSLKPATKLNVSSKDFSSASTYFDHSDITPLLKEVERLRHESLNKISEMLDGGVSLKNAVKSVQPLSDELVMSIYKEKENHSILHNVNNKNQKLKLDIYSNQVSSNSPIEDYIVWKDIMNADNGNYVNKQFFGVFDGHAGFMCAEKISNLFPSLLDTAYAVSNNLHSPKDSIKNSDSFESRISAKLNSYSSSNPNTLKENENAIVLSSSFELMDEIVVSDSLNKFLSLKSDEEKSKEFHSLLGPAVSGSCGIGLVLDQNDLSITVANVGDSRAILGSKLNTGAWKSVELSIDQTADNPTELNRIIKEHPGEENTVILRGRVLGGLMPLRAFGDSRYKWKLDHQRLLFPHLHKNGHKYATTPKNYLSPPYVTAKPIIVKHKISKDNDKFVVMATDGLWDRLSNEQVVEFIGKWIDENGPITQKNNPSSSLINYALKYNYNEKYSEKRPNRLLAIPSPLSRRYRDDISVFVIVLN
ncbi:Protein phosphatase 2C-like protein [Smittium culicis]|uniref:Protein phosphatase 2C-like protein n=1 Tax=Smittium culicis TaxID=133412 RepID=A0A1R1XEE6_9FUNG|nr:Protein phosphatase 2C-like protein [Smittium culicis]